MRPRSDATERGVWPGSSLFALNTGISIKTLKNYKQINQAPLILEMDRSKELR